MKFVKLEDVEKILGDIYESMGSSRHNWYDPLRKNEVEEWWWSDDKNNDFVEHAHWVTDRHATLDFCSNCWEATRRYLTAAQTDKSNYYKGATYWSYCPHCGARMDEEV